MSIKHLVENVSPERVAEFLDALMPSDFTHNFGETFFIDGNSIAGFVAERPPQRYIDRAVFDATNSRVFASYQITESDCDGHLINPENENRYPMMPMAKLAQAMAQVGSILAINSTGDICNFENPSFSKVALVKSVERVESCLAKIDHKVKFFLVPDDVILITADITSAKLTTVSCDTRTYIEGKTIALMPLTYEVLPWESFSRLYKRQYKRD